MISRIFAIVAVAIMIAFAFPVRSQSLVPNPDGQNGKVLGNDGSHAKWVQASDAGLVTVPAVTQVDSGGTGKTALTAYAIMAGGTTSTGVVQQVSGLGTSGYVLTSTGAGALPSWQNKSGFETYIGGGTPSVPCATSTPLSTAQLNSGLVTTGGTLKSLYVTVDAPGVGSGDTVIILRSTDGGATFAQTSVRVSISGTATYGSDVTHTQAFNSGDLVAVYAGGSALTNSNFVAWKFIIQ